MADGGGDWLSRTLVDLRKSAKLSQTAAAEAAHLGGPGAGQVRLSRIETGTFVPSEEEVRSLCGAYRASPAMLALCVLWAARDTRAEGISARIILREAGEHQARLGAVEEVSREIRNWQPLLIPGLLQTDAYARAVFSDRLRGKAVDRAVAARLARAHILDSDRQFTFVVSEGALRWSIGAAAMREQLAKLADAATRYRFGVVPQASVADTIPQHGFGLFDDRLVVLGLRHGAELLGDSERVAEYVVWFAKLEALAVFGEQARQVIKSVARSYRALL